MENTSLSIWSLIAHAGWMGKFVIFTLFFSSIASWAIILFKYKQIKLITIRNRKFLELFWSSKNMEDILEKTTSQDGSPLNQTFRAAMKELQKLAGQPMLLDNVQRALEKSSKTEMQKAEQSLGWLATAASSGPFVGLFGTVWGIMRSFQNIGASGSASLAVVAPGISEALIATAMGLLVAIPAAIAYNTFLQKLKRISGELEVFHLDFINIVNRTTHTTNN